MSAYTPAATIAPKARETRALPSPDLSIVWLMPVSGSVTAKISDAGEIAPSAGPIAGISRLACQPHKPTTAANALISGIRPSAVC